MDNNLDKSFLYKIPSNNQNRLKYIILEKGSETEILGSIQSGCSFATVDNDRIYIVPLSSQDGNKYLVQNNNSVSDSNTKELKCEFVDENSHSQNPANVIKRIKIETLEDPLSSSSNSCKIESGMFDKTETVVLSSDKINCAPSNNSPTGCSIINSDITSFLKINVEHGIISGDSFNLKGQCTNYKNAIQQNNVSSDIKSRKRSYDQLVAPVNSKKDLIQDITSDFTMITIIAPCNKIYNFKISANNVKIFRTALLNNPRYVNNSMYEYQCFVADMSKSSHLGQFVMSSSTIFVYDLKRPLIEQNQKYRKSFMYYSETNQVFPSSILSGEMHLLSLNDPYIIVGNDNTILLVRVMNHSMQSEPILDQNNSRMCDDMLESESSDSPIPTSIMHRTPKRLSDLLKEIQDKSNTEMINMCSSYNKNKTSAETYTHYVSSVANFPTEDMDLKPVVEINLPVEEIQDLCDVKKPKLYSISTKSERTNAGTYTHYVSSGVSIPSEEEDMDLKPVAQLNEPVKRVQNESEIKISKIYSISDKSKTSTEAYSPISSGASNLTDNIDLKPVVEFLSVICNNKL